MAPPGMPKTTSTPSASSERTTLLAPLIGSPTPGASCSWPGRWPGWPGWPDMSGPLSGRVPRCVRRPDAGRSRPAPETTRPLGPGGQARGRARGAVVGGPQPARRPSTRSERTTPPSPPTGPVSIDTPPRLAIRTGCPKQASGGVPGSAHPVLPSGHDARRKPLGAGSRAAFRVHRSRRGATGQAWKPVRRRDEGREPDGPRPSSPGRQPEGVPATCPDRRPRPRPAPTAPRAPAGAAWPRPGRTGRGSASRARARG